MGAVHITVKEALFYEEIYYRCIAQAYAVNSE